MSDTAPEGRSDPQGEGDREPACTYLRCRHCRGFYESDLRRCKWCQYETPVLAADSTPRIYPDRATCRAIQLAEFEQLPSEAHGDGMGPPKQNLTLKCGCLHCGQDGHVFEAIEMRWIANERMWACPCTTCGGRGYGIDIHSIEPLWECAECGHFYAPADGVFKSTNAKCPKCGCTYANGWFEDDEEFDEEDFVDGPDEAAHEIVASGGPADDEEGIDWEDDHDLFADDLADDEEDPFNLGLKWKEDQAEDDAERGRIPDDIDFPQKGLSDRSEDINEDDIPY